MSKGSPREKRHARTKQAILDAAQEIVAEQGPEGLSMRELANRIEYSPSGLYEYFGSKEEIIGALCMEGLERLSAALRPSTQSDRPWAERLVENGMAYLDFATRNPQHYLLMFGRVDFEHFTFEETQRNDAYGLLHQIIQGGVEAGEFRTHEGYGIEAMTYAAWALVHGLAMLQLTMLKTAPFDTKALNRLVIEGMVANAKKV